MTSDCKLIVVVLLVMIRFSDTSSQLNGGDYSKLSGIIIPGFASTQLRAWSILDCPYSPLDFNPLDLVWLDTTKVYYLSPLILVCIFHYQFNSYHNSLGSLLEFFHF